MRRTFKRISRRLSLRNPVKWSENEYVDGDELESKSIQVC